MNKAFWVFVLCCTIHNLKLHSQGIEHSYLKNKTPQYNEVISFYKKLDEQHKNAKMFVAGTTDAGLPLHVFVISPNADFDPVSIRNKGRCVLLVNNGIHPGEPDGIDASMVLAKQLLKNNNNFLKNVVVCIIPVYNIDGALNRGSHSRANQNGPAEYGFRGNAQHLDLNRDFIKCDSKNAISFTGIFHTWSPDIFIDTHVSNGADYQYVLTLIASQKDKLTPSLGRYLNEKMLPDMYKNMEVAGVSMAPYVDTYKDIPDSGIVGFLETPRFATGYAALFNTLGFTTEMHMLKPYSERVEATISFLQMITRYADENASEIIATRKTAIENCKQQSDFSIQWSLDSSKFELIKFRGYEAGYKSSVVTGMQRLFYDRNKPFEKNIPYYNTYASSLLVNKPVAYIIPQSWQRVIDRLKANNIEMKILDTDTAINVESIYIDDYKTSNRPYEGHYIHSKVKIHTEKQNIHFLKGDYIVYTQQPGVRYIMETLEPQATDSYFNWGFFDAILQQKEWFSDYVFEDIADSLLKNNNDLKQKFNDAIAQDSLLKNDSFQQLYFIYKNSPYFEKSYLRYPAYRLYK